MASKPKEVITEVHRDLCRSCAIQDIHELEKWRRGQEMINYDKLFKAAETNWKELQECFAVMSDQVVRIPGCQF